jgi:hypothetical protein
MSNPTGSTNLAANLGYVWTDGDVYEILQTDTVEGAAAGASFSGLGVDNYPHQVLLNKIQYTHNKQLTDEGNIAYLLSFIAQLTSNLVASSGSGGNSGWAQVEVTDSSRGTIPWIVQWGEVLFGVRLGAGLYGPYSFARAFPNACLNMQITTITNSAADGGYGSGKNVIMMANDVPPSATAFSIYNNQEAPSSNSAMGFYYLAIGF